MKWPRPEAGEVVLALTADGQNVSASVRLATADLEAAFRRGKEFIERHAPPIRDGRQRLEEAKVVAAKSNRTVWVIVGGPRCGPCFRLARWIDRRHEALEKDLVIAKITATSYLDRLLEPMKEVLAPDVARALAGLRANVEFQARVDVLRRKANDGILTPEEDAEYKDFVEAIDVVSIIQSKARQFLAKHPS